MLANFSADFRFAHILHGDKDDWELRLHTRLTRIEPTTLQILKFLKKHSFVRSKLEINQCVLCKGDMIIVIVLYLYLR